MTIPMNRLRRRARLVARRCERDDRGSFLLESIIAISLITVIMGAVAAQYITGLRGTSHQRAIAVAVQLADSAVEDLRSLHSTDLLTGRDLTSATSEYTTLSSIPAARSYLSGGATSMAYDSTAVSGGASAAVPTVAVPQTPGGITYSVYKYLECVSAATSGACVTINAANYIRGVVVVTWPQAGCPTLTIPPAPAAMTCSYVTSTLFNEDSDPTFDLNQNLPAAPSITNPGAQTVAVNDAVSLQLYVQNNTGVAPFTWQITGGSLPSGLALNPAGLISGSVTGSASTASTTITVTDAFIRSASVTINWTVRAALAFAPIPNQSSLVNTNVSYTVSASGGSGSGYTYSVVGSSLPTGLSLNATTGLISGRTAATATTKTVTLKVTDSTGTRSATISFTWTIDYPPLAISNPGTRSSTVGTAVSQTMSASGGDGVYVWSATGLPAGLVINRDTGTITGTPQSPGTSTVTVTVSDPSAGITAQTTSFTWRVYAAPTITSPGSQSSTQGATVSVAVTSTCGNPPCTYALTGQPNGIVINASTGAISGTVAGNAATASNVVVRVTDAGGASASTSPFTWTVYPPPTLSGLATRSVGETSVDSVAIDYTCPYAACVISLGSGAVPGIGLETSANQEGNNSKDTTRTVKGSSGTVYLTGTVDSTAVPPKSSSSKYAMSLTITDAGGFQPAASTATWMAYAHDAPAIDLPDLKQAAKTTALQAITYACPTSTCTITYSAAKEMASIGLDNDANKTVRTTLTVSSGSAYVRGTLPATPGAYVITLSITDNDDITTTTSATWNVT